MPPAVPCPVVSKPSSKLNRSLKMNKIQLAKYVCFLLESKLNVIIKTVHYLNACVTYFVSNSNSVASLCSRGGLAGHGPKPGRQICTSRPIIIMHMHSTVYVHLAKTWRSQDYVPLYKNQSTESTDGDGCIKAFK